ncbi:MAG: discoidin domain-containing protein [Prevotellaceae bacterium]|nr:discoidin domain-containing protein [Prevotellaceae bacterium]
MKKMQHFNGSKGKPLYAAAIAIVAVCMTCLCACEADPDLTTVVAGSPDNVVYINNGLAPVTLPQNTAVFGGITNTPGGTVGTRVTTSFGVRSTKPSENRIRVKLEIDRTAVPEGYTPLPDDIGIIVEDDELTILPGQTQSEDQISVTLDNDLRPLGTGRYAFAIKITRATGGAKVSANLASAPVVLITTYTNIQGATTPPGSTFTKPTGAASWTVTGIATNPQYMLDASTSTGQYASTGANPALPLDVVIDMKEPYTITGFHTRTSSTTYRPTAATIYTRLTEDDEWTPQGNVAWTTSPQYVRFYSPVTTRYVRISITAINSANGIRYTDFVIYR